MTLFLFTVLAVSLTILITTAAILETFREKLTSLSELLGILIKCPQCCGFWVGVIGGLMVNPVYAYLEYTDTNWLQVIYNVAVAFPVSLALLGSLSSLFSLLVNLFIEYMQLNNLKREVQLKDYESELVDNDLVQIPEKPESIDNNK